MKISYGQHLMKADKHSMNVEMYIIMNYTLSKIKGLKQWNEQKHQQWRQRMMDARSRKQELVQNQKRQIKRMQDEMVGLLGQRAIDEMEERIEEKKEFIQQLEEELADIEKRLNEQ